LKTAEPKGSGGSNPSPSASFLSEAERKPRVYTKVWGPGRGWVEG
jgi:hypothetical protein